MDQRKLGREKLLVEKIQDKEIPWPKGVTFPHCDARVLHTASRCVYCADATALQQEREQLGVSNTGTANRKWPCPADKVRSAQSLDAWHGNRPYTKEDVEKDEKLWNELLEKYKKED